MIPIKKRPSIAKNARSKNTQHSKNVKKVKWEKAMGLLKKAEVSEIKLEEIKSGSPDVNTKYNGVNLEYGATVKTVDGVEYKIEGKWSAREIIRIMQKFGMGQGIEQNKTQSRGMEI
jgi:hypothetical protein